MRIILVLISLVAIGGCQGAAGSTQGPPMPAANSPEAEKQAQDAINNAPPELRDQIRAQRAKSMGQSGPPPDAKK